MPSSTFAKALQTSLSSLLVTMATNIRESLHYVIPIVVKLNMTKIVSNGLVGAITCKDTFIKLISYAKKAEYQSLVPVFEKAVAETSGFKDLINGSPVAVDVFFGLAKQKPSIAIEEIVGVSNLARNLPDESIATFVTYLGDAGLRAAMVKEPGLVDAWKTLDDAGYAALKKNTTLQDHILKAI